MKSRCGGGYYLDQLRGREDDGAGAVEAEAVAVVRVSSLEVMDTRLAGCDLLSRR